MVRLNDLTFQWVDTLDLKDVVNDNIKSANKVEYQYRIYAYAIMENGDDKSPIVFTFDLPGTEEDSIYKTLENMKSIKRIISVEEINPTVESESYPRYHK